MAHSLRISNHALERFRRRVLPRALATDARLEPHVLSGGRSRPTRGWWVRGRVSCGPGVRFCYSQARAIVVDGTVVTVVSRATLKGRSRSDNPRLVLPGRTVTSEQRARGRCDGELPDDDVAAA
jgi:hypothetical protein